MAPSSFIPMVMALAGIATAQGTAGVTTRYWDCCKPSCGWSNVAPFSNPVTVCNIHDQPLSDGGSASSACPNGNGEAFMCSSQQPWALTSNLAYGFAAVTGSENEQETCCACYLLSFTTGPVAGKQMVVQSTNIGYDVSATQFDLAIPGGGVGAYPAGCQAEWNAPSTGWGAQYGGVSSVSQCSQLPTVLQPGCEFRFKFLEGANNPNVTFSRVACPAALLAKTNCQRSDDSSYPVAPTATSDSPSHQTSSPPPPPPPTQTQTTYGQCGGSGWTGPTACPPGTSCEKQNPYYSQCLTAA